MKKHKNYNDDEDESFLSILIFLVIFILLVFFLLIKYHIMPVYEREKHLFKSSNATPLKDINMSQYLRFIFTENNISTPQEQKRADKILKEFVDLHGDSLYRSVMLRSEPINDLNISISDVIFETNRYTVFLIVYQAEQLIKAYKLYGIKRGRAPSVITNLVDERILTTIPKQHEIVTKTGWTLSDNTNVGVNNVAFIMNLDGLADNEMKLDFCNIVNFYANNEWSLQSTEADIIALGSGKSILENGYAANNDAFFCYSTGTAGEYKFQLVFAKWTGR